MENLPGPLCWNVPYLNLRGAQLVGLDLRGADVRGVVDIQDADITQGARLDKASFADRVVAGGIRVRGPVTVGGSAFEKSVDFSNAVFERSFQGTDARFLADVSFDGTRFEQDAVFRDTLFARGAIFAGSTFVTGVTFAGSTFEGKVHHQVLNIFADGTTSGPLMYGGPIFRKAVFGELILRGAKLHPGAVFAGAKASRLTTVGGSDHNAGDEPVALDEVDVYS